MNEIKVPSNLPPYLRDVLDGVVVRINPEKLVLNNILYEYPTEDQCKDRLDGGALPNEAAKQELEYGFKLATLAYAMPTFMAQLTHQLHLPNTHFTTFCASLVAQHTAEAFQNMDEILRGERNIMLLPRGHQMAGFMIRSPVRVFDQDCVSQLRIPVRKQDLVQWKVRGNVNVWVMRRRLHDQAFECYVLFRGTSNPFVAAQQYGSKMQQTQLFAWPTFDYQSKCVIPEGSDTKPLFLRHYFDILDDVTDAIERCLEMLHVDDPRCQRIVVAGHSMGGALTTAYAYHLHEHKPSWWDKAQFRSYAAPMWCNDAAVLQLEQWLVDSLQKDKFYEVINTDDFVHIQNVLQGKSMIQKTVDKGMDELSVWVLPLLKQTDPDDPLKERVRRILQVYPEVAAAVFLRGSLKAQGQEPVRDRKLAARVGHRFEEAREWDSLELKATFNHTVRLFHCDRAGDPHTEFIGKFHSHYVGINVNLLWAPTKTYEAQWYARLAHDGLQVQLPELIVLGLFGPRDAPAVSEWIQTQKWKLPLCVKPCDSAPEPSKARRKGRKNRTT